MIQHCQNPESAMAEYELMQKDPVNFIDSGRYDTFLQSNTLWKWGLNISARFYTISLHEVHTVHQANFSDFILAKKVSSIPV